MRSNEEVQVWTTEWPTEPGWYWFAGYKWGDDRVSMGLVEVREIQNGIVRIIDGHFMWKDEGHRGVFTPTDVPIVEKSFIDKMVGDE